MATQRMLQRHARVAVIFEDIVTATQWLAEKKADWKGYNKDPDTGEYKHSSGKKENKKFANNTTFSKSPGDALLHTDANKAGIRGRLSKDHFVFSASKDELKKDPRKKWYPVSSRRGWASAAGSLRKVYEKGKDMRQKVMSKVKTTKFVGREGKPIEPGTIDPIGRLKGERPECKTGEKGEKHPLHKHIERLRRAGKHDQANKHARRLYRLCKDHGPGGPNEYQTEFQPSKSKLKKLHAPVAPPWHNIKAHKAATGARQAMISKKTQGMMKQARASETRFSR